MPMHKQVQQIIGAIEKKIMALQGEMQENGLGSKKDDDRAFCHALKGLALRVRRLDTDSNKLDAHSLLREFSKCCRQLLAQYHPDKSSLEERVATVFTVHLNDIYAYGSRVLKEKDSESFDGLAYKEPPMQQFRQEEAFCRKRGQLKAKMSMYAQAFERQYRAIDALYGVDVLGVNEKQWEIIQLASQQLNVMKAQLLDDIETFQRVDAMDILEGVKIETIRDVHGFSYYLNQTLKQRGESPTFKYQVCAEASPYWRITCYQNDALFVVVSLNTYSSEAYGFYVRNKGIQAIDLGTLQAEKLHLNVRFDAKREEEVFRHMLDALCRWREAWHATWRASYNEHTCLPPHFKVDGGKAFLVQLEQQMDVFRVASAVMHERIVELEGGRADFPLAYCEKIFDPKAGVQVLLTFRERLSADWLEHWLQRVLPENWRVSVGSIHASEVSLILHRLRGYIDISERETSLEQFRFVFSRNANKKDRLSLWRTVYGMTKRGSKDAQEHTFLKEKNNFCALKCIPSVLKTWLDAHNKKGLFQWLERFFGLHDRIDHVFDTKLRALLSSQHEREVLVLLHLMSVMPKGYFRDWLFRRDGFMPAIQHWDEAVVFACLDVLSDEDLAQCFAGNARAGPLQTNFLAKYDTSRLDCLVKVQKSETVWARCLDVLPRNLIDYWIKMHTKGDTQTEISPVESQQFKKAFAYVQRHDRKKNPSTQPSVSNNTEDTSVQCLIK